MLRKSASLVLATTLLLSGCSSLPEWADPTLWFEDEEEAEAKLLDPIQPLFDPVVVWDRGLGEGADDYFSRLRPAIGYGAVFAADRHGRVAALEPDTGKVRWERNFAKASEQDGYLSIITGLWDSGISAKLAGGLTLAYEKVFFGSENGEVFALDANSGETLWQVNVRGEVLAAPAVDEGIVVVNTSSGLMFGLDAETGEEQWLYESDVPPLSLRGVAAPVIAGGGAIVGTGSGKVAVTLVETGQLAWEQAVGLPTGATELERIVDIDSKPLVLGGLVYVVSFDGTLAALELRSGRVVWKREYKSYRRISMDANTLFVADVDSVIYALDRRNGIELWSQSALRGRSVTAGEPLVSFLVVGDKYGFLHWLNQSTGEIVARMDVGGDDPEGAIYAAPVADGRILYTQTRDGDVVAIQTP